MWTWRWDKLRELHPVLRIEIRDCEPMVKGVLKHELVVALRPMHWPGKAIPIPAMPTERLIVWAAHYEDGTAIGYVARGDRTWRATTEHKLELFIRQQLSAIEAELRLRGGW